MRDNKIKEALRLSEARLREAQRIAHLGYWEWNLQSGEIILTDEVFDIFGPGPFQSRPTLESFLDNLHPEDRDRVREAVQTAIKCGAPYSLEYRIVRPTGEGRTVAANGMLECGPEGDRLRMIGTIQDITELKKYEEDLADRVRHASLGAEIGYALTRGGTLHEMLQGSAQALVDNLGALFARIWVLHREEDALVLYASAGLYTHLNGPHGRLSYSNYKYKIGIIARERTPLLTNDVPNDPQISDKEWAKKIGLASYGGYPLVVEGETVGVLAVFSAKQMSEATFGALSSFADEIAIGIKRKQAVISLKDSEERFRSLVEESFVGAYIFQDERFIYANPRLAGMLGYSHEELMKIGNILVDLVFPEDRHIPEEMINSIMTEGKSANGRFRGVKKNGSVFFVETVAWGTQYRGRPAIIGKILDVTEQVKAEEALKESEADLRTILDSVHDAIFVHDLDMKVIDVNEKVLQMCGVTREEAMSHGSTCYLSSPENPLEKLPGIWRQVAAGERLLFEWKARRPKEGIDFDVEVFLRRVRLKNRDVVLANVRDITERKKAEAERSGLFNMLTHDIKGPLTVISGYSELLAERLKDEETLSMLWSINHASYRIAELVGDMLDVTRAESRKELSLEPVAVPELILQAVKESEIPAKEKGVRVEVELKEGLPDIEVDRSQVVRALSNLVNNAIKYNREGGMVRVVAENLESVPGIVRIEVADTGTGIPRKDLPHIFEKFYRGRKARATGTGLGLSVVKAVADAHGGEVSVKSREGEGSAFFLCLPVRQRKEQAA